MADDLPLIDLDPHLPVFPQLHGVFVLNKPEGPSSAACLRLFKQLGQKKIGHAGTLDPFASGVLIVLLGNATKLSDYIHAGDRKIYKGTIRLGLETDTWDGTGQVIAEKPVNISETEVTEALRDWVDLSEQEVPPFSAAKHNGQSLYKLARKGAPTPKKFKPVEIFRAQLLNFSTPEVTFRVFCGSGVYIRSLAHSLGKRAGCGACLTQLTREYSYPFELAQATEPEALRKNPGLLMEKLVPAQDVLPDWEQITLTDREYGAVCNGISIPAGHASGIRAAKAILIHKGEAIALAELFHAGNQPMWRIKRGLLQP